MSLPTALEEKIRRNPLVGARSQGEKERVLDALKHLNVPLDSQYALLAQAFKLRFATNENCFFELQDILSPNGGVNERIEHIFENYGMKGSMIPLSADKGGGFIYLDLKDLSVKEIDVPLKN